MAYIRTIAPEDAIGEVKQHYDAGVKRAGRVCNILRISSLNPRALDAPKMMPTAMSSMFPRKANSLNSFSIGSLP